MKAIEYYTHTHTHTYTHTHTHTHTQENPAKMSNYMNYLRTP